MRLSFDLLRAVQFGEKKLDLSVFPAHKDPCARNATTYCAAINLFCTLFESGIYKFRKRN